MSSSNLLTLLIAYSISSISSSRTMTHTASTKRKSPFSKSKSAPSLLSNMLLLACSKTTLGCSSLWSSLESNRSSRTRYKHTCNRCTSSRPPNLAKLLSSKTHSIYHRCKDLFSSRLVNRCFTNTQIRAFFSNLEWVSLSISKLSSTKEVNRLTAWECQSSRNL